MSDTSKFRSPRRTRKRSVTLDDVAALAGVSHITASRALQPEQRIVLQETAARVSQAALRLGYIPNLSARSLASRRSGLVIALVPTLSTSTFAVALDSLRSGLARHHYQTLIGDFGYANESEAGILRLALGRRPDAIVTFSTIHSKEARALLKSSNVPVVEAWDKPIADGPITVGFDNEAGGAVAARHLLSRGRRRLAYVANLIAPGSVGSDRIERRWHGFAEHIMKQLGSWPRRCIFDEPLTYLGGRTAMRGLLAQHPDTDAAFFAYDEWAAGAVFECLSTAIRVPDRLAICGFGGLPIASAMEPRLTTVAIPMERLGREVAELVVDLLNGSRNERRSIQIPLRLTVGATT